jgi:hypothetical protein
MDRGVLDGKYGRFHVSPQLRMPLSPVPWISLTVHGGEDVTYYGDTIGVVDAQQTFVGKSLTRALPFGGAELVGPSFSRIYNASIGPFGKLKHIIEPGVIYAYESTFDQQKEVPIFDEIDPVGGGNTARFAITNRILGKPTDTTKGGGAREILSFEVARRYSLDDTRPLERGTLPGAVSPETSQFGPWEASLRAYPTQGFGLRIEADYSSLFGQLTGVQASGNFTLGRQQISFTWTPSWEATTGEELSDQGTIGGTFHAGSHLTLSSYVTYDFQRSLLRDQRHMLTYAGSCYALHVEIHEFVTTTIRRTDYLFSVDLKNVGTFLDLNGGESSGL